MIDACLVGVSLSCCGHWLQHADEPTPSCFVADVIRRIDGCKSRVVTVMQALQASVADDCSRPGALPAVQAIPLTPSSVCHQQHQCLSRDKENETPYTSLQLSTQRRVLSEIGGNTSGSRTSTYLGCRFSNGPACSHTSPGRERSPLLPAAHQRMLGGYSPWKDPARYAYYRGWVDLSLSTFSTASTHHSPLAAGDIISPDDQTVMKPTPSAESSGKPSSEHHATPSEELSDSIGSLSMLGPSIHDSTLPCSTSVVTHTISSKPLGSAVDSFSCGLPDTSCSMGFSSRSVQQEHSLASSHSTVLFGGSTHFNPLHRGTSSHYETRTGENWPSFLSFCNGMTPGYGTIANGHNSCVAHRRDSAGKFPSSTPSNSCSSTSRDEAQFCGVHDVCSTAVSKKTCRPNFFLTPIEKAQPHNSSVALDEDGHSLSGTPVGGSCDLFASASSNVSQSGRHHHTADNSCVPMPAPSVRSLSCNPNAVSEDLPASLLEICPDLSASGESGQLPADCDTPLLFSEPEITRTSTHWKYGTNGLSNDSSLCRKLFDVP